MSWQSYVDDHLMVELPGGGKLSSAAIYGQDGGCWAQSAGFPTLDADQAKVFVSGFSDPGSVAAGGIKIGDRKFISIGGIPGECLRGRKGAAGCCVKKTNTAMVIGIYDEGVQGGDCNVIVENLGDYLIGQNI
eukprot:CAMPEP_0198465338 /NCGR_PEP_ID=MMETSP1456-20131121/3270_1 /TAXON_ID=1461544 ORGANISM="Unidentified sp., Strain RCC1871" /NCGR_SAMPLE_ID=MMETSP1456 /ASSEMBLY_ACC=CAM_ASM_001119 /LENGTH=132 /DNA_ID=CAMNT_0044191181 /DNA_START=74 /DNA_END=472 /DNA_ORIENTATION=+